MPMGRKQKKWMSLYMALVLTVTVGATTAFAAGDPLSVINNLSTFIFSLIRAIGLILLGFGVVQVGLSLKSHEGDATYKNIGYAWATQFDPNPILHLQHA